MNDESVRWRAASLSYPDQPACLSDIDVSIPEGNFTLVLGRTGSGKSTLLRSINGLMPRATGGSVRGEIEVCGRSTARFAPRDLASVVGFCPQEVSDSFVADTVENELAWSLEQLAESQAVMRRRVEDVIDLLALQAIRSRPLGSLSSGQQQRVAIGALLATSPRVLVLDEPTSALDPQAAEDVLSALLRLVHDVGLTVIASEHKLERIAQYADSALLVDDGAVVAGSLAELLGGSPLAPPVMRIGDALGWPDRPFSLRDARRLARPWRERIAGVTPPARPRAGRSPQGVAAQVEALTVRREHRDVLSIDRLQITAGVITALMGRNGAGKSTLLEVLYGRLRPTGGDVRWLVAGGGWQDPSQWSPADLIQRVGVVPAAPDALLLRQSVAAECALADDVAGLPAGATFSRFAELVGLDASDRSPSVGAALGRHPRDLSAGQRLALVLAIVLGTRPPALLLDEPTVGLDPVAKRMLADWLVAEAERGVAILIATHDVELVADIADRVVVLADGDVIADGPADAVVSASSALAPQLAKVTYPHGWVSVDQLDGSNTGAHRS